MVDQALPEIQPRKILAGQHDPQDMAFVSHFLSSVGGYEVVGSNDGVGLIKQLKSRPDLIVMDTVPQGNFLKALEIIRRTKALQGIPIVVYTYEQTKLKECFRKGADGFILKPCSPAVFLGKIWKAMGAESRKEVTAASFSSKYKKDIEQIDNLPTLPTVYTEVDRLCKNPDVSSDELSKVIETDPSITLKLLNLSNSAFFGFTRQIKSVRDAISLLGNKTVQNTILSIAIFEVTKDLGGSAGLDKNEFWLHSTAAGSVARFLSNKLSLGRDEAFTSGIVHDMGKIILDALYSDFYAEVLTKVSESPITIYDAEEDVIGLNHCQIGLELAQAWNLPPELSEAVAYHHRPSIAEKDKEIASLVNLGDAIARELGVGSGGDQAEVKAHPAALKRLQVTQDQLEEWTPEIQEAVDKDKAILSILKN
jgi:HD-like signal output (HDOD) protein/CheY-like chemotaxis protein